MNSERMRSSRHPVVQSNCASQPCFRSREQEGRIAGNQKLRNAGSLIASECDGGVNSWLSSDENYTFATELVHMAHGMCVCGRAETTSVAKASATSRVDHAKVWLDFSLFAAGCRRSADGRRTRAPPCAILVAWADVCHSLSKQSIDRAPKNLVRELDPHALGKFPGRCPELSRTAGERTLPA